MSIKKQIAAVLSLLLLSVVLQAQTNLYIKPGNVFHITGGTTVSVDSLIITPTLSYTLTGENNFSRHTTLLHTTNNTYITRVYRWSNTLPAFTGTIGVYYRDAELNGLTESGLALNVYNGSGWTSLTATQRDAAANLITTNVSNLLINELTLADVLRALPLRWISADSKHENGRNHVLWITTGESGCKNYQVQKSSDGINWQNAGTPIAARNATGNQQYQFTDADALANLTWYRIQQNDLDGKFTFSKTMLVQLTSAVTVNVYPNPFTTQLTISSPNKPMQLVQVYSVNGALVQTHAANQNTYCSINSSGWAAGTYRIVILLSNGSKLVHSVIKEK